MVLKIEYLLVLIIVLLIVSILGIRPTSKPAIHVKEEKEVVFKKFSLFELTTKTTSKQISSSEATKYKDYLELKDINVSDEEGHSIIAKHAIYEDEYLLLREGVRLHRADGLTFSSQNIFYNLKTEEIKAVTPFFLEFNGTIIKGTNLEYNLKKKEISADNIRASIIL